MATLTCAGPRQDSQLSHMLQPRRVKGPCIDRGDGYAVEFKCYRASRSAVGRPRHAQGPVCFAPRAAATRVWELHRGGREQSVGGGWPSEPTLQLSISMVPRGRCRDGVYDHDEGVRQNKKRGARGCLSNREPTPLGWSAPLTQQLLSCLRSCRPLQACAASSISAAAGTGRDGQVHNHRGNDQQQQRKAKPR